MSFKMSWRKRHSYEQVQFYALLLSSPGVCVVEFCQALNQLLILGWYNPTYLLQVQIIHLESQKAEQPEKILIIEALTKVKQILHDIRLKKLSNLASLVRSPEFTIEICTSTNLSMNTEQAHPREFHLRLNLIQSYKTE